MREILFRGQQKDGTWLYGDLFGINYHTTNRGWCYINGVGVGKKTVGQYTGLTDKNGKKIFEGDICSFSIFHHDGSDTQYKGVVTYSGSRYMLWHGKDDECWGADGGFDLDLTVSCDDEIEVIGNIHDNPEWLEVE